MKLSLRHYAIIIAALITAFLHIGLFPDIMFTLNGVGYLGLLGAYFLPMDIFQKNHKLVWWGIFGYTALTMILWLVMGDKNFVSGESSAIGYYAKIAEAFLMVFLWADKSKA